MHPFKLLSYRDLTFNLVSRDLKIRYKGTFLGFFWSFLNPLLNLLVLSIVFSLVVRISVENYPIFLLIGILAWQFLALSITSGARSIVENGTLIKKVSLAREVFPVSVVFVNLFHLSLSLIILLLFLIYFKIFPSFIWILFPYFLVLLFLFVIGLTLIVSALSVYFRDVPPLIESILPAWYFLSPVIYPSSFVPQEYQMIYFLNPMAAFLTAFRSVVLGRSMPDVEIFVITLISTLVVLSFGYFIFSKLQKRFAEEI